ncbi:unnamed protein product [Blepharisma stoltei]|uniref:Uncharacterized protein n=1 Tax=Blepharisma stoltei TaxID=1481888 RepID=A0AAU9JAJ6_9CILI|nr:unnamed protein product [Blepharisma stoltei]
MLPAIKEDESAIISNFSPKKKPLKGFDSIYLKSKAKELLKREKIKIPLSLLNYRKKKFSSESSPQPKEFPSINSTLHKLRNSCSDSPSMLLHSVLHDSGFNSVEDAPNTFISKTPDVHRRSIFSKNSSPRLKCHFRSNTPINPKLYLVKRIF